MSFMFKYQILVNFEIFNFFTQKFFFSKRFPGFEKSLHIYNYII